MKKSADSRPKDLDESALAARIAEIEKLLDRTSRRDIPSMEEFDASEYDEDGNCR